MKAILIVGLIAIAAVFSVVLTYVNQFGYHLSADREHWGQFGDYIGGLLNPTFSLLAFGALLWSIKIQERSLNASAEELKTETVKSKEELRRIKNERISSELLIVVRDIDSQIERFLEEVVSPHGRTPELKISQMSAEAYRLKYHGGNSTALDNFVAQAKTPGSVIEAKTRELISELNAMQKFLEDYSSHSEDRLAPVICYYAEKSSRLVPLGEAIGGLNPRAAELFQSLASKHG